jgi:hypothetical protein
MVISIAKSAPINTTYRKFLQCIFGLSFIISLISRKFVLYNCNRCGKLIGDHNYTVHIIRHAFDDMKCYESENVIESFMTKETESQIATAVISSAAVRSPSWILVHFPKSICPYFSHIQHQL